MGPVVLSFAMQFWLFLILVVSTNSYAANPQLVNVTVPGIGEIVGKIQPVTLPDGQKSSVAAFQGIPYAEPPMGELRFAKPVPKENISSPLMALDYGPACPQVRRGGVQGSEDCLYMNVYVLSAALQQRAHSHSRTNGTENTDSAETLLPVLVWLHGGAFIIGSGNRNTGNLAVFGDIIVVTLNYRLGPLGFLSTDDHQAPGNFGLWDQRLALLWVKNNIAAFGGDPNMITVGGDSAGAFCVTFQALYPPNQGLLQRFIAASGSALSGTQYRTNVAKYARDLAEKLNCSTSTTQEIVTCLRQKTVNELLGTNVNPVAPFETVWAPSLDHDFIPERPAEQLSWPPSGANLSHLQSVDALFATTAAEGIVSFDLFVRPLAALLGQSLNQGVSKPLYNQIINDVILSLKEPETVASTTAGSKDPAVVNATGSIRPQNPGSVNATGSMASGSQNQALVDTMESAGSGHSGTVITTSSADTINPAVLNAIDYEYRDWSDPADPATLAQSTVDLLTDRQWFIPNVVFCRNHAANNSRTHTYLLQFDLPKQYSGGPAWLTGAQHVGYSSYAWGQLGNLNLSVESDRKKWELSKAFMTYWSNFIKTGDTNSPTPVQEQWLPFTVQDENYLDIDFDVISARKHCKARRTRFWLDYIPKVKVTAPKVVVTDNSHPGNGDTVTVKTDCRSSGSQKLWASVWVILIGTWVLMMAWL